LAVVSVVLGQQGDQRDGVEILRIAARGSVAPTAVTLTMSADNNVARVPK
jgi:hypothetical protein